MATQDLNITISLSDEISASLGKVSNALDEFGKNAKSLGREIKEVGNTMAMAGAAITGPLTLAFINASQNSAALANQIDQLKSVATQFQKEVAQAILPVVQTFVRVVENLFAAFNNLSPSLRESILQGALITGIFLTISGVVASLVGRVFLLIANLSSLLGTFLAFAAANIPLMLILGSITAIVFAMFKWKAVGDTIVSTFEVVFRFLMNGFHSIEIVIGKMAENVLNSLLTIVEGLARIPGPTQAAFNAMADKIRETAGVAHEFANLELQEVATNTQKIGDILKTGEGEWSHGFDGFRQGAIDAIDKIKQLGNVTKDTQAISGFSFKLFADSAKSAVGHLQASLQGAAAANKEFARATQVVSIGMALMNAAEGVTMIWAKWGAFPWIAAAFTAIEVAATGIQIATIAQQKFHSGGVIRQDGLSSDEVPIIAQTGEGVLSRRGMDALGGESALNLLNSGKRLASNVMNSTSNVINIYIESPRISSSQDVSKLGEDLGFAIDSSLRSARGF